MDKHTRFANTWKAVNVTSRVRWQQNNTIDRFNALLVKRLTDQYGDDGKGILADVSYQIGIEDGRKICENLRIDPSAPRSSLMPLETIALMSGVDAEVTGDRHPRQLPQQTLTFKSGGCIFSGIFGGIDPSLKDLICEKYTQGLVHAVNKNAEIRLLRKCCGGNRQCEFAVTLR